MTTPPERPAGRGVAERIRWPDGPVCPYCGERERMTPESRGGAGWVRYECVACARHRGYFRLPGESGRSGPDEGSDDGGSPHRPVLPRFPT